MREWERTDPPGGGALGGGTFGGGAFALPGMTPVVKQILVVNFAVWLVLFLVSLTPMTPLLQGIVDYLGVTPYLWFESFPWLFPWQFVTYGFIHSPSDPLHLLFNGLFLYFIGSSVEQVVGGRRFLSFYLGAVAVAGLASLLIKPLLGGMGPTVGASGAVLAAVCAAAALQPQRSILLIFFPIPLAWLAVGLVGLDVVRALQQVFNGFQSTTDYVAHLVGAAFGFLAVRKGFIWTDWAGEYERRKQAKEAQIEAADEERLDDLLARINSDGIHSLSEREKAFLKRMSKRK